MTYSCAIFSRGAQDARGGPGGEAASWSPQARRSSRASGCSTSAAAGAASRSGRRPSTAPASSASRSPSRRPSARASGPRRPASPTGSRSGSWTTATSRGEPSTRSPASAWSSTSARPRSTSTRDACARLLEPGGRLLNHGIARLRHSDPEAGPFSERYVFPDAAPLHLSRILLRAGARRLQSPATSRASRDDYAETLRHWAARLDDNLDEAIRARRRRAGARLAPLPARGAARLRDRLPVDLPGARAPPLTWRACPDPLRRAARRPGAGAHRARTGPGRGAGVRGRAGGHRRRAGHVHQVIVLVGPRARLAARGARQRGDAGRQPPRRRGDGPRDRARPRDRRAGHGRRRRVGHRDDGARAGRRRPDRRVHAVPARARRREPHADARRGRLPRPPRRRGQRACRGRSSARRATGRHRGPRGGRRVRRAALRCPRARCSARCPRGRGHAERPAGWFGVPAWPRTPRSSSSGCRSASGSR